MGIEIGQIIIDIIRAEIEHRKKIPFKLCYIGKVRNSNAGDLFNVTVMNYFKLPYIKARVSSANMFNIGSLLNFIVTSPKKYPFIKNKKCTIVGTGFMYEPEENEKLIKDIEVLALRGQISKKLLENKSGEKYDCLLADPGLLASHIFPQENVEKKYKVGFISHFLQKENDAWKNIKLEKYNYHFIDIEQEDKSLMKEINECECILSSSLHGLIFADSYNIPCRHLTIYDRLLGENLKFRDYYSSFEGDLYKSFDIRNNQVTDDLIDEVINNHTDMEINVKNKQESLIKIYTDLRDKYVH